jgi:hypothetical protein
MAELYSTGTDIWAAVLVRTVMRGLLRWPLHSQNTLPEVVRHLLMEEIMSGWTEYVRYKNEWHVKSQAQVHYSNQSTFPVKMFYGLHPMFLILGAIWSDDFTFRKIQMHHKLVKCQQWLDVCILRYLPCQNIGRFLTISFSSIFSQRLICILEVGTMCQSHLKI